MSNATNKKEKFREPRKEELRELIDVEKIKELSLLAGRAAHGYGKK